MANASDIRVGSKVTIVADVTRLSDDKAEVTARLPHYGYPINSVELVPPAKKADHGPKPAKRPSYAGESAYARIRNQEHD